MANLTKNALAQTIKSMLEHTTLDRITVTDLVEACGVKRQTFYYHFSDIYALIEWIYFSEAEKAIGDNRTYATWVEGFYQVFVYILDNQKFVENTYRSVSRDYLERFLYEVVYDLLYKVIEEVAHTKRLRVQEEHKKFIADFYKYAFVGLVLEWIRSGMKEEPRAIMDRTNILIEGDMEKALRKYVKQ